MYYTNHQETEILNTFRGITAVAPSAIYVALMLTNPGEMGLGTEIAYDGYARQLLSLSQPTINESGGAITNVNAVNFATSPIDAGTVTFLGLYDSLVGGNMLAYIELSETIVVNAGVQPMIIQQEAVLQSQGNFSNYFKVKTLNLLRGESITGFTAYIALYSGNPDAGGAELSGGNYARFSATFTAPATQASGQSLIHNSPSVASNRSTSPWGEWSHTAICDAASAGNVVGFNRQTPGPTYMGMSKAASFPEGNLKILAN